MKKLVILLGLLLTFSSSAMAANNCKYYDCVAPHDMNSKFNTVMGAIGGVNFTSERALERAIKKSLLKSGYAEDINVEVQSYSSRDLKNGIFKSFHLDGDNVVLNDIYLSKVNIDTLCDYNYIKYTNSEDITFVEDLPMSFDLEFTAENLNKTMQHPEYQELIHNLNRVISVNGIGLKITSTKVSIINDKFYFVVGVGVPFFKNEARVVLESDLKLKNGRIDMTNTRIVSNKFNIDLKNTDLIINYLNPFDFSINIFKDKNAHVTVMNSKLLNNKISANGYIVIPKD